MTWKTNELIMLGFESIMSRVQWQNFRNIKNIPLCMKSGCVRPVVKDLRKESAVLSTKTTVGGLFIEKNQFVVPPYQRAYSWESSNAPGTTSQTRQFIDDLRQQPPGMPYFFGHFLFEVDKFGGDTYRVVDGQQRLMTVVIFFRVLHDEFKKRYTDGEPILDDDGLQVDLNRLDEKYLKYRNRARLVAISFDKVFFEQVVVNFGESTAPAIDTRSKRLIQDARDYLKNTLEKEETKELLRWRRVVEDATVTTLQVDGMTEAVQVFAFQNDRGKGLSELEKLKAYLMHQTMLADDCKMDSIGFIETEFAEIYKQSEAFEKLNLIRLDEDAVLLYYNAGFFSQEAAALVNVANELTNKRANERLQWIKNFTVQLKNAYRDVGLVDNLACKMEALGDILVLDAPAVWPLILKLFHFHRNNILQFDKVFRLVEITLFKLNFSAGSYRTQRLASTAKKYNGDRADLERILRNYSEQGFQPYWPFNANFKQQLLHGFAWTGEGRYLLWKYENQLRAQRKSDPIPLETFLNLFNGGAGAMLEKTVDHITPQTPRDGPPHPKEFLGFLHAIGNLVLMSRGKNSSLGNIPAVEKAAAYTDSELFSQHEVAEQIKQEGRWGAEEISARTKRIAMFALERWQTGLSVDG